MIGRRKAVTLVAQTCFVTFTQFRRLSFVRNNAHFTISAASYHCQFAEKRLNLSRQERPNGFIRIRRNLSSTSILASASMLEHRDFTVPVPWGDLACQEWKTHDGSSKQCLLLHGWQDNSNSFAPLVKLLPEEYVYVGVDLSGHGLSSHKGAGVIYNISDYLVDVRKIVMELNWPTYAIIGHSMGGCLAQLYAACYPNEVEHIVCLDIVKPLSSRPETIVSSLRRAVTSYAEWKVPNDAGYNASSGGAPQQDQQQPLRAYTYHQAFDFYSKALNGILSVDSVRLLMARNLKEVGQQSAQEGGEKLFTFRRDKRIQLPGTYRFSDDQLKWITREILRPMLIIRAEDRAPYEPQEDEFLEYYKANIKHFHLKMVDGHHHVHMDDPQHCALLIEKFLHNQLEDT